MSKSDTNPDSVFELQSDKKLMTSSKPSFRKIQLQLMKLIMQTKIWISDRLKNEKKEEWTGRQIDDFKIQPLVGHKNYL